MHAFALSRPVPDELLPSINLMDDSDDAPAPAACPGDGSILAALGMAAMLLAIWLSLQYV